MGGKNKKKLGGMAATLRNFRGKGSIKRYAALHGGRGESKKAIFLRYVIYVRPLLRKIRLKRF